MKLKWEDNGRYAWATKKRSGRDSAYYAIRLTCRTYNLYKVIDVDLGSEAEDHLGNFPSKIDAQAFAERCQ